MSKIKEKIVIPALQKAFSEVKDTNALFITITGFMGSGKTTLAQTISYYFAELTKEPRTYRTVGGKALQVIDKLSPKYPKANRYLIIIFDDISYLLDSRSKQGKEALNKLFQIRHLTKKNAIAIFNTHYSRSTAPFIRATPVRILTSLTEAEIDAYRQQYLFTTSALWDYLYYLQKHPDRFIILVNAWGREKIIDITGEVKKPPERLL